ncbi:MAG TPA: thaumatin family protein [Solirubrobacterales bacterium]
MRRLAIIAAVLAAICAAAVPAAPSASAAGHTIFMINNTEAPIWPAAWPGSSSGQTGWTLPAGDGTTFHVPNGWNARVWGRTGCHFVAGKGDCATGDCGGLFQCKGWGEIPATLAEWNLDSFAGLDFYDVSMVDGSNLPMYIRVIHGEADRSVDANGCLEANVCTRPVQCPKALRVPRGSSDPVGCISPCARFQTNRYCCRGQFAAHCSPARTWPIDYAKVFKRAEPFAYSWSGDDATSVFTCKGGCDYEIVFGVSPPPGAVVPPL